MQVSIADLPEILNKHEQQIAELTARINNFRQEPEKPITVYEAAKFLNKEVQTIYGLTSKRQIPFHKNGRELSFFKSELVEWLKTKSKFSNLNQWLNK